MTEYKTEPVEKVPFGDLKKDLLQFDELCQNRLEIGQSKYHGIYSNEVLLAELDQELADISNYCFFLWRRVRNLKEVVKCQTNLSFTESHPKGRFTLDQEKK